jgi:hypothetical protein
MNVIAVGKKRSAFKELNTQDSPPFEGKNKVFRSYKPSQRDYRRQIDKF